jgi:SNF2 family DNA or RNA helicase
MSSAGARPAASSAAAQLLELDPGLAERSRALASPAKDALLGELLAKRSGEKVLLFAAHLATLEHAAEVVQRSGRRVALFHGQLGALEREAAIEGFRESADVLVNSESGGEGFNLQFARTIVNYDLPWNPMRIEQRIGRVHRIGQTREVFIFNLVTAGTIEDEILRVLEEKIAMFELVVGEVEAFLGRLGDDEQEFQELVLDLYAGGRRSAGGAGASRPSASACWRRAGGLAEPCADGALECVFLEPQHAGAGRLAAT